MPPRKSTRLQTSSTGGPTIGSTARENDTTVPKKSPTKAASGGKLKGVKVAASKGKKQQSQSPLGSTADKLSSLPPEILKLTLDNIKDTPTINALSQTCRRLYPIMMPRLYERIVVAAVYHAHIPKLIRTLEPHLTIAQKKQLKKEGKYKGQQERYPSGLDEKAKPTCASYVRQLIVGRADPGRKHKYIVERYLEEAIKNMRNLEIVETMVFTQSLGKSIASLESLKALRLACPSDFRSLDLTSLATVKNLKHLSLSGLSGYAGSGEHSLLRNSASTLKSLVIEGTSYSSNWFEGWENRFPDGLHDFTALKHLSLSYMGSSPTIVKSLDKAFAFMELQELTLKSFDDTDCSFVQHLTKLASTPRGEIKLRTLNLDMSDRRWSNTPEQNKIVFDAKCCFIASFDTLTTLDLSDCCQYDSNLPVNPGLPNVLLQAILRHKNLRTLRTSYAGIISGLKIPYLSATTVETIIDGLPHLRELRLAPDEEQIDQIGVALARGRNLEKITCFPHESWSGYPRPDNPGQSILHGVLKAFLARPCGDEEFVWETHCKLRTLSLSWKAWDIASEFAKVPKRMAQPEVIEKDGREVRARDVTQSLRGRINIGYDPDHEWVNRVERHLS